MGGTEPVALRACEANRGQLSFIEVVMGRFDLPALLARTAELVPTQNNRA
jgi:TPP-dependent 2-oxoacid decarboxylase